MASKIPYSSGNYKEQQRSPLEIGLATETNAVDGLIGFSAEPPPPLTVQQPAFDSERMRFKRAAQTARLVLRLSHRRLEFLTRADLGDPSWHILLDLLVREYENRKTNISAACLGSGAPSTTALRHITDLEAKGYIRRLRNPEDTRMHYLELGSSARLRLIDLLADSSVL